MHRKDDDPDIPLLAESLLARVAAGRELKLARDAVELLRRYDYPGNIRELRNILERASLLCDGAEIQPAHLPAEVHVAPPPATVAGAAPPSLKQLELQALRSRLALCRGSRKALARELGISERTLYRRLKQIE